MVWNALSFWDGQPVTSPVYPQMGDMMDPNTSGYQRTHHPHSHRHPHPHTHPHTHPHPMSHHNHSHSQSHQSPSCYLRMDMGMGDFRQMSCPMPNYIPQFREPCLDDGEAFRAYNGMDTDQGYAGGGRPGGGSSCGSSYGANYAAGAKGDFW
ncbi:probable zinc transporter protein DDB_G0283629 [Drosophila rhopaloa]|uniref:Probable zinc transporter protein DDB_G0283629 n=1 Tax=Drosophila rhopaloa TaxID=1041015 RepID=A0A6P4FNS8_DRORH|nr:probable zinc transporter protein DDB_G0283629 [Drosophila rhopaloa]